MITITGFTSFINYFRGLATSHVDIASFAHGNSERILHRTRSDINYPVLWLETPDVFPREAGQLVSDFRGTLLILTHAQEGDWEKEDEEMHNMLAIVYDLVNKIMADADDGLLQSFALQGPIEPKGRWGTDNDWGWRFSFTISVPVDCLDEEKFA